VIDTQVARRVAPASAGIIEYGSNSTAFRASDYFLGDYSGIPEDGHGFDCPRLCRGRQTSLVNSHPRVLRDLALGGGGQQFPGRRELPVKVQMIETLRGGAGADLHLPATRTRRRRSRRGLGHKGRGPSGRHRGTVSITGKQSGGYQADQKRLRQMHCDLPFLRVLTRRRAMGMARRTVWHARHRPAVSGQHSRWGPCPLGGLLVVPGRPGAWDRAPGSRLRLE
jgi:hypothetical protein